jgi:hypothetical protein
MREKRAIDERLDALEEKFDIIMMLLEEIEDQQHQLCKKFNELCKLNRNIAEHFLGDFNQGEEWKRGYNGKEFGDL